jgi:hypothetical protein
MHRSQHQKSNFTFDVGALCFASGRSNGWVRNLRAVRDADHRRLRADAAVAGCFGQRRATIFRPHLAERMGRWHVGSGAQRAA